MSEKVGILVMSFDGWRALNKDILSHKYRFSDIDGRFLEIIQDIDELRKNGKISVGVYRQKGNLWRNMIIALIEARCSETFRFRQIPSVLTLLCASSL